MLKLVTFYTNEKKTDRLLAGFFLNLMIFFFARPPTCFVTSEPLTLKLV